MQPGTGHKPLYSHLYFQVLVAIAIGVLLGMFLPGQATAMKPLGDGFIKLIKMMIAPIIFTTVVVGIAKMGDMKEVGRVGLKALIYFELVSTLALVIGLMPGGTASRMAWGPASTSSTSTAWPARCG